MRNRSKSLVVAACAVLLVSTTSAEGISVVDALSGPLRLEQVLRIAGENRPEITAAAARAEALSRRPAIVGSLEDPMIAYSVDHYPFKMMEEEGAGRRFEWSATLEQRFPLSGVLTHRRRAAYAQTKVARAEVERTRLDVGLQAQEAFFMLRERRRMAEVLEQQRLLAEQLIASAASRYAAGTGLQADVLRAEVEQARVMADRSALEAQTRAAAAMLNARMGRAPMSNVPALSYELREDEPPPAAALVKAALQDRPELRAGQSEVERARAESDVMRAMYRPMAMLRVGRASTMAEGGGAMVMMGVSIPIFRARLDAGVDEARAMERMAQADLAGMRLMVESDAVAAREDVIAALARYKLLRQEVVPRSEMAVEASLAAYAAGKGTLVTVVDAVATLWESQSDLVMAETAVANAWARLDRTVGAS